jgi:hypothetical protein
MGTLNLSTLFGTSTSSAATNSGGLWNRPTHETTCQMAILPGGNCCFSVPSGATRVVIEMWGQGGGGANACCCQWGMTGGQGGSYAYKVFTNLTGTAHYFCGCVCTCDCQSYSAHGSDGQFARLTQCTGSWTGCVNGGYGGDAYCTATCWWGTSYGGYTCNVQYNTNCLSGSSTTGTSSYPLSESTQCVGPSCICGGTYICIGASGPTNPIGFTTSLVATGGTNTVLNTIFPPITCACFDAYRQGACGFTYNAGCTDGGSCCSFLGVGGAAYAGGAQQTRACTTGPAYCGYNGNFPGGGGRSGGAFGGGCCFGGAGGGGLILLSYKV